MVKITPHQISTTQYPLPPPLPIPQPPAKFCISLTFKAIWKNLYNWRLSYGLLFLIRVQDAFTSLSLRVILIVSMCFYMDMNCFGLVRVILSWLQVDLVAAGSFGWVVTDGFGWLRMVSDGFECFRMVLDGFGWFRMARLVCCFSSYVGLILVFTHLF